MLTSGVTKFLNVFGLAKEDSSGKHYETLKISQGCIRGLKVRSVYGDCYYSFEGIPFAEPPLGHLRFKSPQPVGSWNGIKDCFEFKHKPLQKNENGEIEGSEDCLYLNVFSKDVRENLIIKKIFSEKKLPVLVWIYGGGFGTGGCIRDYICGPDYFMMEDVVLVTFNYRLSMIGFLSLCDPSVEVPGNAGLKDQVLALKWIKGNVGFFGGDANNVTLFGQNAGGASVHYLLSTDRARNLFHKAICQSGCMLHDWAISHDAIELSYLLACRKGYKGPRNNDKCILEFLQSVPAEKLIDIDDLDTVGRYKGYLYAFMPSIEPYETDDSIITKPAWELIKCGWGNNIPLIVGGTSFEGLSMYPILKKLPEIVERLRNKRIKLLPNDFPIECTSMAKTLAKLHFGDKQITSDNICPLLDYYSYRMFWHGLHRFLLARLKYAKAPTYQYCFDFNSPIFNHHREILSGGDFTEGVAHGDDLSYLFYSYYSSKLDTYCQEYFMIRRMIKMWTAFAKTSNPNCEYICSWHDIKTAGVCKWMNIACELRFIEMPKQVIEKLKVWNDTYGDCLIE
uniref:carboxylesterase n=1 Tax=Glossina brevipalpis TaxID=37001 RepID=A0A1A9W1E7_9MUSC